MGNLMSVDFISDYKFQFSVQDEKPSCVVVEDGNQVT